MSNAKSNSGFRGSGLMDLGIGSFPTSPHLNFILMIMPGMAPFTSHLHSTAEQHVVERESEISSNPTVQKIASLQKTKKSTETHMLAWTCMLTY